MRSVGFSVGVQLVLFTAGSLLLAADPSTAQPDAKAAPPRPVNPAMQPVKDDPQLPRVLLIGDSISIGYTLDVRKELEGEANVHRPLTNCGPTTRGLKQIDAWLGKGKWDVIHFNWGLHDLKHVDENGAVVAVDKGHRQVPIDEYEKNLETLVKRLKETGATLIWCSTTPVPEGASGRISGDEVKYNAVAARVMRSQGVEVNDLYEFAKPRLAEIQRRANVHFTPEGSAVLAKQVAATIRQHLPKRK